MVRSQISYGLISTMRFAMPCRSQQVGKEVELLEDEGLVTTRTKTNKQQQQGNYQQKLEYLLYMFDMCFVSYVPMNFNKQKTVIV